MKRLTIAILVAAALWSGYWFVGSYGARRAFEGWFAARRAEGWQADYTSFHLQGFPNRFDAVWRDLALADPDTGLALEMPQFGILALSYKPHHVIAVWPKQMMLRTPLSAHPLSDDDLRASLRLHPGPSLQLERAQLSADKLVLSGDAPASLDHLSLAMAQLTGDAPETYRLGVLAQGATPPAALVGRISGGMALPATMQELKIDATVSFTRPWDISALNTARPQPRHIALTLARAQWGELVLQATGDLEVDAAGLPTGELSLQARNWRDMLKMAVQAGAVSDTSAGLIETTLGLMARMGGNPDTLDASVTFHDGGMYFGPVAIGPAPVLRLR